MFDATGRISLQIMRSTLPKFASNKRQEGTPEENKAIVQGLLCFIGTYSVNETDHILNLHIESSSFPNWNGINQSDLSPSLGMKGRTSSAMMQPAGPLMSCGGEFSKHCYKRTDAQAV
jgi:Lipocalin-like domain